MFQYIPVFISILLSVVSAYDRGYKDTLCPVVKPLRNFNFTAYTSGRWYEIARYSNDFVGKGDCVYMDHKCDGDDCTFTISDVINHKTTSVGGTVRNKYQEISRMDYVGDFYKASENANDIEITVLSTDYDSYAILYYCRHNAVTKFHHEFTWILSRKQFLEEKSKNFVKDFLKSSFINEKLLIWDHFDKKICE